jgi:EAL domain-containing protein (putative c-di-GMP-specific phosphodiesterase class I)
MKLNADSVAVFITIMALSRALGFCAVSYCVETPEQATLLIAVGAVHA